MRRDSGESYEEFLTKLANASGIGTPTRADLARIDRKRKKKGSNDDWTHPHDPDAKILERNVRHTPGRAAQHGEVFNSPWGRHRSWIEDPRAERLLELMLSGVVLWPVALLIR